MKISFVFILLFEAHTIVGQPLKIETIKKVNPITKELYIFPNVTGLSHSSIAQKINDNLRGYVLGMQTNSKDENIFDSIWRTTYRMENVTNLSFKVSEMNLSLISLSISGEGCGAYCEAFKYYFTFNAKTGNQLTLDSLFTDQGLMTLLNILNNSKTKKINNKLKQIKDSLSLPVVKINQAEKARFSEMQSMYTDCLDKNIDIQFINQLQFLTKNETITIFTDRCSAHYNMVYDDLWTFVTEFDLTKLKDLLNEYGLSLIKK